MLISLFFYYKNFDQNQTQKKVATYGVEAIAFSSDPLDYNYLIHHAAFSSVFAKLISNEKNGEYFPMIASSWKNENNFKTWVFKIRTDLTYSNGERITLTDIEKNFKRLIYLNNKKKSESGLLEFLVGFDNLKDINSKLDGFKATDNTITFNFVKPMPDLLERLSFGFYGIAHPSLYDQKTGVWLDKMKVISSGPYEVTLWNKEQYHLKLRTDVHFHSHENRLNNIEFSVFISAKNANEIEKIDFLAASKGSLMVTDEFEYISSSEKLKVGYVQVSAIKNKKSIFQNKDIRKWLRYKFYNDLYKNDFPITLSFLPQSFKNIKPLDVTYFFEKPMFKPFSFTSHFFTYSARIEENKNKKSITDFFSSAINALGENSGAELILENNKDDIYDIEILGSGFEASDYMDTLKLMFLSKDAIRLPDITGKIKEELKKENPDINFINREIWDQAVIWPIRHYSSGYWFNKNSNINYEEMNFNSPSVDFQFLKWN